MPQLLQRKSAVLWYWKHRWLQNNTHGMQCIFSEQPQSVPRDAGLYSAILRSFRIPIRSESVVCTSSGPFVRASPEYLGQRAGVSARPLHILIELWQYIILLVYMVDWFSTCTDAGHPKQCTRGWCTIRYKSSNRIEEAWFDPAVLGGSGIGLTRPHILGGWE